MSVLAFADLGEVRMAYRELGTGAPIVLLHGNPTSSYLWRRVAPGLADLGRVVAPDLVGMGRSSRVAGAPGRYSLAAHADWLDRFLDAVLAPDDRPVLVGHDWGGTLAADRATRRPERTAGLAWTEATLRPRRWDEEPPEGVELLGRLRGPEGERLVLEENFFVEQVLRGAVTGLTADDLAAYRLDAGERGEGRRAILDLVRQIPFDGEPAAAHGFVAAVARRLEADPLPKLFLRARPGAVLQDEAAAWCASLPATTTVEVGAGHFVPEDDPDGVIGALRSWIGRVRPRGHDPDAAGPPASGAGGAP